MFNKDTYDLAREAGFSTEDCSSEDLFKIIKTFEQLVRRRTAIDMDEYHKETILAEKYHTARLVKQERKKADKLKMSLIDHYAGLAMQGMLANPELKNEIVKVGQSWIEESAWRVAKAMMEKRDTVFPSVSNKPLDECEELSNRTRNALLAEGIETTGDLFAFPRHKLKMIVNVGKVGQAEISKVLGEDIS